MPARLGQQVGDAAAQLLLCVVKGRAQRRAVVALATAGHVLVAADAHAQGLARRVAQAAAFALGGPAGGAQDGVLRVGNAARPQADLGGVGAGFGAYKVLQDGREGGDLGRDHGAVRVAGKEEERG